MCVWNRHICLFLKDFISLDYSHKIYFIVLKGIVDLRYIAFADEYAMVKSFKSSHSIASRDSRIDAPQSRIYDCRLTCLCLSAARLGCLRNVIICIGLYEWISCAYSLSI